LKTSPSTLMLQQHLKDTLWLTVMNKSWKL